MKMDTVEFKFSLGQTAKDTVTGLVGKITCQSRWMTGCNSYNLQPPVDEKGKVPDSRGVDELILELVEDDQPVDADRDIGGPHDPVEQPR